MIRPARREDAAGISRVILAALHATNAADYGPAVITRVAQSFAPAAVRVLLDRRTMFVAEDAGTIVGTAGLDGRVVRSVFVAPEHQGRGLGRALMAAVERAAIAAGVAVLAVPASVTAEAFYAKLGYRAVREAHHGEERAIVMERLLVDPAP